jgi:hypothetical protein
MDKFLQIPVVADNLIVREIDDEIVILSEAGDQIHSLEATAAFLWKCIDGSTTIQALAEKLCREYDVTVEQVREDVMDFITDCLNKQLIILKA